MEAGTPDKEAKEKELHEKYDSQFDRFIVTIHPKGLPGDIPGKEIYFQNYIIMQSNYKFLLQIRKLVSAFLLRLCKMK